MEVYRLKHIPTGLYFTPSKGRGNLSKKGKFYVGKKPSLDWCKTLRIVMWNYKISNQQMNETIRVKFNLDDKSYIDTYVKTQPSDWLIETVI